MFLFNVAKKNEDGSVKSFEMLKLLNRIIFRGASCKKIVCCSSWSLLGIYSTTQLKYIIPFVARFACGTAIIVSGISISAWLISYFVYDKEEEEMVIIETEHEKFLNFINNDYDLFIDIYKNKSEEYFTNESKSFISELKDVKNHENYELPYSYNPKMVFYYDDDSQSFHYYCQSDVPCKILNSVCRSYTIGKKCIQLFQDEEEIKYMKGEAVAIDNIDVSFSNVPSEAASSNSLNSTVSSTETDEKEEESNGFINIFYNKKSKNKQQKMNKEPELSTNKFIYKGTLEEYSKIFVKTKTNAKETTYEEYLAQCSK